MVFTACFVLTSIQYEWKSIFHLDIIVSAHRQLKAPPPRAAGSPSAFQRSHPPSNTAVFYTQLHMSEARAREHEASGTCFLQEGAGPGPGGGGRGSSPSVSVRSGFSRALQELCPWKETRWPRPASWDDFNPLTEKGPRETWVLCRIPTTFEHTSDIFLFYAPWYPSILP